MGISWLWRLKSDATGSIPAGWVRGVTWVPIFLYSSILTSLRKENHLDSIIIIITSRYPVGISTEFCFRWQGEGDKGGKGKKTGGKTEGEKKEEMERKKKERREGESNRRRASISLKSPMPYPSPTVTLSGQFWTFIVIMTFDLCVRYCACVRTNRETRTIIIDAC